MKKNNYLLRYYTLVTNDLDTHYSQNRILMILLGLILHLCPKLRGLRTKHILGGN